MSNLTSLCSQIESTAAPVVADMVVENLDKVVFSMGKVVFRIDKVVIWFKGSSAVLSCEYKLNQVLLFRFLTLYPSQT